MPSVWCLSYEMTLRPCLSRIISLPGRFPLPALESRPLVAGGLCCVHAFWHDARDTCDSKPHLGSVYAAWRGGMFFLPQICQLQASRSLQRIPPGSSRCGTTGLAASWECWDGALIPGQAQWVKDLALPQMHLGRDCTSDVIPGLGAPCAVGQPDIWEKKKKNHYRGGPAVPAKAHSPLPFSLQTGLGWNGHRPGSSACPCQVTGQCCAPRQCHFQQPLPSWGSSLALRSGGPQNHPASTRRRWPARRGDQVTRCPWPSSSAVGAQGDAGSAGRT